VLPKRGPSPRLLRVGIRLMRSHRTLRTLLVALTITGLVLAAFGAGIGTAWLLFHRGEPLDGEDQAGGPVGFGLFWEAWDKVEAYFYGDLPDTQHLVWGAIRGSLATLGDAHTTFLEPEVRTKEKQDLSGRFGGIGARVSKADDGSIVLYPMADLPAAKAGVQASDILIAVDGQTLASDITVEQAVALVRGEVGSSVALTLRRAGVADAWVVEIVREEIPNPSVEFRMLEGPAGVGYVRVLLFSDRTDGEVKEALSHLEAQGMLRLVLDLRGNGGGLLNAAIDVGSEFLGDGVIAYQVSKGALPMELNAKRGGAYLEGALVVLIDGGTASASEIVAGALQDRGRARLVGDKSFGKGSVQSVVDLSDGSSLHITSAQWETPNRHQISGQGLTPDAEVAITDDDRAQGLDPQLDRAVELLTAGN